MVNKWYEIKAKGDTSAEINIYGDIGESWFGESVTAKSFVDELAGVKAETLTVNINSYGGSVADGLAIFNALKRSKAKVTTRVDGVAVSIASLIAMAGDTLEMADNALLMIHAPWSGASGNAVELRRQADVLDTYAKAMANSYAIKGDIPYDEALALLTDGADHWYTAQEAMDAGFVDVVTEAVPVAASFDFSRFKTVPAAAGMFVKPKPEITMAKAKKVLAADQDTASEDENLEQEEQEEITEDDFEETEESSEVIIPTPEESAVQTSAKLKDKVLGAEKARREDIRAKFKPFAHIQGVETLKEKCLDDHKITVSAAVEKLMDVLGAGMEPTGGVTKVPKVDLVQDETEKLVEAGAQALMARCGMERHDYTNPFRAYSLLDFAKASLEKGGIKTSGKDRLSIARMALSQRPVADGYGMGTADFTLLLENVMHKTLLTAYNTQPDTWSQFCSTGSVQDFRDWNRYRTGSIGDIEQVNEHGEYKDKTIPDGAKEKVNVKRRGNIIQITPELVVNDDMNALSDLTTKFGRAAKRTIETAVYKLLASNPVMNDGLPLFHATRGNLAAAGAVPSVDEFDKARIAMGNQKDIGANEFLDIYPKIWLGPLSKGSSVRILNTAQYDPNKPTRDTIPNAVNGLLSNIIDTPRITGTEWYFFADPASVPVIEVTFLDGQREPQLAQEENFRTAGLSYRVELPFGVAAVDVVGAYKNPGS